jgi:hypothetical protein
MVSIKINCDFCNAEFEEKVKTYPHNLLQKYGVLKNSAESKNWIYHSWNKRWYCPRCAEYRNAYEGKLEDKNRENLKEDWHYVEDKDFPPFTKEGVGVTVLDQDNKEVFYTKNCGWLYHDPSEVGQTYAEVYKWRYK